MESFVSWHELSLLFSKALDVQIDSTFHSRCGLWPNWLPHVEHKPLTRQVLLLTDTPGLAENESIILL